MSQLATTPSGSIWKNRTFNILLINGFLLAVGAQIYELVIPLIIYELTHSSVAMASMRTAELLPNFLFAIFIGVIVDRLNKKTWSLWMVALQVILLVTMAVFVRDENHAMFLYYMIGFLLMTFSYGYFNAQISLTKLGVPGYHLTSANAKFSFVESFVGVMGPAISAAIFALANSYDGLFIAAGAYLLCFVLLTTLSFSDDMKPAGGHSTVWSELSAGWRAFRANRILRVATLFTVLLNSTDVVVTTGVVFIAKDKLHLSSALLAMLFATAGIGGLIGSSTVKLLRSRYGLGVIYGASAVLNGISYFGLYFAGNAFVLIVPLLLHGFASTLHNVAVYTLRHEQTPANLIGRISGITGTLFRIGMPITMVLSGWAIAAWGPASVFLGVGILNVAIFAFYRKSCLWTLQ